MQMRGLSLQVAGALVMIVAIAHGVIGELRIFAAGGRSRIEPELVRRLTRLVWLASTVDWLGVGLLLIAAPSFASDGARKWVVAVAAVICGFAAIGNALAVRGFHLGWVLMGSAAALALAGI
jgi:hypothetical protein